MIGGVALVLLGGILSFLLFSKPFHPSTNEQPPTSDPEITFGLEPPSHTSNTGDGSNKKPSERELKIQRYRSMLDRAETRERVLVAVKGLLDIGTKECYEILKLKLLNKGILHKLYQLDFTGRLDAKNRPELVPASRRIFKLILDLMVQKGSPEAEDILYAILDTGILDRPENTYYYNLHLETLLAISRFDNLSSRSIEIYKRLLKKISHHRYSAAEKEWALAGLHNLKTKQSYEVIIQFILEESRKLEKEKQIRKSNPHPFPRKSQKPNYAFLGLKTLIQTNDLPDIQALMEVGEKSVSPEVRIRCYKALAGIPGPEDMFGVRITANREFLDKKTAQQILAYLKDRLKKELDKKAISILRMAIRRLKLTRNFRE